MDYLGKGEVLTNTDLDRFVNNIWEKYAFCVHEKVLSLWVQLMNNGGKNKSVALIIFYTVHVFVPNRHGTDLSSVHETSRRIQAIHPQSRMGRPQ